MASDLPDDLLEEIFLRLDDAADLARTSADLARTSAACASFRRVVSNSRFLRRFRSHHRRPVLGLLLDDPSHCKTEFVPVQSPRRFARAAAGFAKAADFTFSFLPDRKRWHVCDVRDSRILLTQCPNPFYTFEGLVVYDPLHRRHVHIPNIPGDVLVASKKDGSNEAMTLFHDPFLVPAVDEDDGDDDEFQVMCTAVSKTEVVAFVFSSASGQWRCVTSFSHPNLPSLWSRQYVHSCICWLHQGSNDMLVFDTREMKFSMADLPRESNAYGKFKMPVEARDGRLGLLVLVDCFRCDQHTTMDLYSKAWQGNGVIQESEEWRHDSSIRVPGGFHLVPIGAAEGYVLLRGIPPYDMIKLSTRNEMKLNEMKLEEEHYFTLDLKTMLVEKLCVLGYDSRPNFLYASFPPPFSPPTV